MCAITSQTTGRGLPGLVAALAAGILAFGALPSHAQTDDNLGYAVTLADDLQAYSLELPYVECQVSLAEAPFPVSLFENTTNRSPLIFMGPPDGIHVGIGGSIVTFDFLDGAIEDLPGPDFNVYEVDRGAPEFQDIDVLVSLDGITFISVKATEGPMVRVPGDELHQDDNFARSYDIGAAGLGHVKFVRIDGVGTAPVGGCCVQFDLDAIGAIHHDSFAVASPCEERGIFPIAVSGNTTGHTCLPYVGPPDDLFLGIGGQAITFDFGTVAVKDGAGPDFNVYEADFGADEFSLIDVSVSGDGVAFVSVKTSEGPVDRISGDSKHGDDIFARSYDLAASGLPLVRFVRISGDGTTNASGCCSLFDLDAIGAINYEIDQDADGLTTCDEISRGIDPLRADTDGDGISDGAEVSMSDFGECPSPLLIDSDGDGLADGTEIASNTDPCDADSDGDGLPDGLEIIVGTYPLVPDTDGDGLLDGTEVDVAGQGVCPNPLVADSDGDTIPDGLEVEWGTNPCVTDTDGDGLTDEVDPLPLTPNTSDYIRLQLQNLCIAIEGMSLDRFEGPNNNARKGRRNAICNKLNAASSATGEEDYVSAMDQLKSLREKLDDQPKPRDWMSAAFPEKTAVRIAIDDSIVLLLAL